MFTKNKLKIINDPIYGFVSIPNILLYDLMQHRYFQRLRRINQMGLSYLVYPGANHTRFHHALGSMHMMQQAVQVLRFKQVSISDEEEQALYVAILLHDIGHGPFSHAMEQSIVENVHHEELSLRFMNALNAEFNGELSLAIEIFQGYYHRPFFKQLISGQLDMDRMDYLKRDSFYSGVAEGNINSERLIQMINVKDNQLVVEQKGIYSVEKFLVARRLMYWQCYFHKTSVTAEQILTKILQRAKELTQLGEKLWCSPALEYFLDKSVQKQAPVDFSTQDLEQFSQLDDSDVLGAIKQWQYHTDEILSSLCSSIVNRKLFAFEYVDKKTQAKRIQTLKANIIQKGQATEQTADYLILGGQLKNQAYDIEHGPINILFKDGSVKDVADASDQNFIKALTEPVLKYFICYPKWVNA